MSLFKRISELQAGTWVNLRVCECSKCGHVGRIKDNTRGGMPSEFVEKKFRQAGWENPSPTGGLCPNCAIESIRQSRIACPTVPVPKGAGQRDSFGHSVPNEGHQSIKPEVLKMAAEAPREATPQDRRRIRDALDEHYLEDKGCYRQSFSDKALAAKLTVPAKWVSDLREFNGYGPDKNEDAAAHVAEFDAIRKDMSALETDVLKRLDEIGKRISGLQVKLSYVA